MSTDSVNHWIEKAKAEAKAIAPVQGVKIIRREEPRTKGAVILEMAEKIKPWLAKMFEGVRDENNMVLQPAHVSGIALNVAQGIVNAQEEKLKKASA